MVSTAELPNSSKNAVNCIGTCQPNVAKPANIGLIRALNKATIEAHNNITQYNCYNRLTQWKIAKKQNTRNSAISTLFLISITIRGQ